MYDLPSLQEPGFDLILASRSEARAAMLKAAGLSFGQVGAGVDENAMRLELKAADCWAPEQIAIALARAKTLAVSAAHPAAHVIGADQVLDVDGAVWDKPGGRAKARQQLLALKGQTHMLHSAACIALDGKVLWETVDTAHVRFRDYSADFVDRYLNVVDDSVFNCVGACQIEALGVHVLENVSGDYFTVLGMPLIPVLAYLREAGLIAR